MGNAICTTPKDVTVRGSKEAKGTLDPANEAPTPVYLPLDVLSNVLSRLPVKTLCKLMCVSREWLKLISSDQHFLDSHSKVSQQNPVLLFTFHCFVNRRNKDYAIQLSSVDLRERFYSYFRKSGDSFYTYSSISCAGLIFKISSPACSNGVIYWLFQDKNHLENRQQMIALDLETEEFHMDPRNQIWVKGNNIGFSALEDCLAVCCYPVCDRDGEILLEASPRDEGNRGRLFFYDPAKKSFRTTKNLDRVEDWFSKRSYQTHFPEKEQKKYPYFEPKQDIKNCPKNHGCQIEHGVGFGS
ncbi:hypothetical protein RJ639_007958 [Escallonia herrerae]|uniref:F-box domain-containing protein n=1 Tax=Escallonia herrerae TaxID=1293975 RepID=A0AA88VVM0_9ASTE|nr:hypothetical protein RJ639_007958 [Escallonia herrerae]